MLYVGSSSLGSSLLPSITTLWVSILADGNSVEGRVGASLEAQQCAIIMGDRIYLASGRGKENTIWPCILSAPEDGEKGPRGLGVDCGLKWLWEIEPWVQISPL